MPKIYHSGTSSFFEQCTGYDNASKGKIYNISKDYSFYEPKICKICTQSKGHRELHPEPIFKANNYQNFIKIKFFNLNSNFDQATQKRFKKQYYMAKIITIKPIILISL